MGKEVLHPWEATDVVDLVEDNERGDLPMLGTARKQWKVCTLWCFALRLDVGPEVGKEPIVVIDPGVVYLHALSDLGIGEALGDSLAITFVGDLMGIYVVGPCRRGWLSCIRRDQGRREYLLWHRGQRAGTR